MSQRAFVLSIVAILAFVGTTLFAADMVAGRINTPVMNCPQPQQAAEQDSFNHAIGYGIYSALDEANRRELILATHAHPDLAPELRYQSFSQAVALRRSFDNLATGRFKHTPFAEDPFYAADFAAFKERYQREHPTDKRPIE